MGLFNIENHVILITGGGVLGESKALIYLPMVLLLYKEEIVELAIKSLIEISDNISDVIIKKFKKIDILINAAGGNMS